MGLGNLNGLYHGVQQLNHAQIDRWSPVGTNGSPVRSAHRQCYVGAPNCDARQRARVCADRP
ncbi:hypothetical protein E1288_44605 [Saccharopolyspora elongata]|uniref:Uncharacterized protein n=1 Tax=Saccharopolyspora elongata TaxID=2530387 RepID=A0A4R4XSM2_9PSEU|nr:hypothetical protein E1288_44605 [Saccharopolyspora elongata]